MLGNPLTLCSIAIPNGERVKKVTADGKEVPFEIVNGNVLLNNLKIQKELCLK